MNWLQFIADMTGHLAWPTMVVAGLIVLRKPLLALLPELQRLKIKDFEFDFSKTLDEAKREVEQITKPSDDGTLQPRTTKLTVAQEAMPAFAVLEAWHLIEKELTGLAIDAGITHQGAPAAGLIRALGAEGLLDGPTLRALDDLRKLRNLATHTAPSGITEREALEYRETAKSVAEHISWIRSRLGR
jgi:hypothetical protein